MEEDASVPTATEEENLLNLFEKLCFTHGDLDAIRLASGESLCFLELQELSIILASQLHYRFRPGVILVDCYGHVVAEAVAILACLRLRVPFVPVSVYDQHAGAGRLNAVVKQLRQYAKGNIVAICGAINDRDPALGIFYQAEIYQIVYLDRLGNLCEQIHVPRFQGCRIDQDTRNSAREDDNLYILFTSGTSSNNPKAVVGSHQSTCRRLQWFRDTFAPSPRIARRTKLTFVDSMTELFSSLLHPPSVLVAVEPDDLRDQGLESLLTAMRPSQLSLLPSQLAQLFLLPTETLSCLERVIVSGEPCPASLVSTAKEKLTLSCQFINLYGQTESTGDIMAAVLTNLGDKAIHNGVVAVGSPILPSISVKNTENDELVIEGNLANGYLGDSCPFDQFTTGDIGFCRGGIWYVKGRRDDVVKVNGILTSPSEVETVFANLYKAGPAVAVILEGCVHIGCEQDVPDFSRQHMHEAGIPWNLIPSQVWRLMIPVSDSGAGKINRAAVRELIRQKLASDCPTPPVPALPNVHSIICDILHRKTIDSSKSFVELGGDSASSIHLLYLLRQAKLVSNVSLSALDILESESINEIESLLKGSTKRRRVEKTETQPKAYSPLSSKTLSQSHTAVPFVACVDSSAVLLDRRSCFFYLCCQGGLVGQINATESTMIGFHYFPGWKFEADCLFACNDQNDTIVIICGYNDEGKGLVVALDQSLKRVIWQNKMNDEIRRVPALVRRRAEEELWVRSASSLAMLNVTSGSMIDQISMPSESFGRPLVDVPTQTVWYSGGTLLSVSYTEEHIQVLEHKELSETLGPCHKDGLIVDNNLIICDSWGQIHVIDALSAKLRHTVHVASSPLSSPVLYGRNKRCLLVGSYEGRLMSFHLGDNFLETPKKEWEVDVGSVIFAKPLLLPKEAACVVCTTAGDIVIVDISSQSILEQFQIQGEILSNPKVVDVDEKGTCCRVAFGARDSQAHILTVKLN